MTHTCKPRAASPTSRCPNGERAGQTAQITLMPLRMDGQRLDVRCDPPRLGQHTAELLQGLGYTADEVAALQASGAIA